MKEFKHTKGPWFINESEVCAELKEGIITIAEIARTGAGFTRKEEDANAKLIAAAPELLEALKEAEWQVSNLVQCRQNEADWHDEDSDEYKMCIRNKETAIRALERIKFAIKKATE